MVYGYPSNVEIDIAMRNEKTIFIEASSHIRPSDISLFKRKVDFYELKTKKRPDRVIIVTPYIEDTALEASLRLGFEVYTKA